MCGTDCDGGTWDRQYVIRADREVIKTEVMQQEEYADGPWGWHLATPSRKDLERALDLALADFSRLEEDYESLFRSMKGQANG